MRGIRKTFDEFVNEAVLVHGGKYEYNDTNYINSRTKIGITCPVHGVFYQTPTNHLYGNGCPDCKRERLSNIFASNTEEFIEKARKVHGNKYDYSKVKYKNNSTGVIITCPIHGDFIQSPNNHLSGRGCPICNESKLERDIKELLSLNEIVFIYQWRLPWNKYYSLDFYLPDYNIGVECQGVQHFEDGHFKNGLLDETKKRDKYKNDLCLKNGIEILYYSNIDGYGCITDKNVLIDRIYESGKKGRVY